MKTKFEKIDILFNYKQYGFPKNLISNECLVLKDILFTDKPEEPELMKFSKKKPKYFQNYILETSSNNRSKSNFKNIPYQRNTSTAPREVSIDMGWRKNPDSKPIDNSCNNIKLNQIRKNSNESDFAKGSKLEENQIKDNDSKIQEETKENFQMDIKLIYKVNEYLEYPNTEPLWYILHPAAKSSYGPLSSLNLEDMWNNRKVDSDTEVRFVDIYNIIGKQPFTYFKLNEIQKNFFIETIELSPLFKLYSFVFKKEVYNKNSPIKENSNDTVNKIFIGNSSQFKNDATRKNSYEGLKQHNTPSTLLIVTPDKSNVSIKTEDIKNLDKSNKTEVTPRTDNLEKTEFKHNTNNLEKIEVKPKTDKIEKIEVIKSIVSNDSNNVTLERVDQNKFEIKNNNNFRKRDGSRKFRKGKSKVKLVDIDTVLSNIN